MDTLARMLLSTTDALPVAGTLALLIARRFGRDEALHRIQTWRQVQGVHPTLFEAEADVLNQLGQGQSDAVRALQITTEGLAQYPHYLNLYVSHAEALSKLWQTAEAKEAWQQLAQRVPTYPDSRAQLARLFFREGNNQAGLALLREAVALAPLEAKAYSWLANALWRCGQPHEAVSILRQGCEKQPDRMDLLEGCIDLLSDLGSVSEAEAMARDVVARFPESAYGFYLLARTLHWSGRLAEAEQAFRRALALNAGLYVAADTLAQLLARQGRFADARDCLVSQARVAANAANAANVALRLAWITRQQGQADEARAQLGVALEQHRLHEEGWLLWMTWVQEDGVSAAAVDALLNWPEPLAHQATLQALRLEILADAGGDAAILEPQWGRLLAEFPDAVGPHCRYFDRLLAVDRLDEATAVIQALASFHPADPYVMARQAQVLVRSNPDEAVRLATVCWLTPGKGDTWPALTAWASLRGAWHEPLAVDTVLALLVAQQQVRLEIVQSATAAIAQASAIPEPLLAHLHGAERRRPKDWQLLVALLRYLESHGNGDDGSTKAAVITALADVDGGRDAIWDKFAGAAPASCTETPVWQAIVVAFTYGTFRQKNVARSWLMDFRERPGVGMWVMACLPMCYLTKGVLKASPRALVTLYEASRDALDMLPSDHTARFHACIILDTALRLKRHAEYALLWERYKDLITSDDARHFTPEGYAPMLPLVSIFGQLLHTRNKREAHAPIRQLLRLTLRWQDLWIAGAWMACGRGRVSWPRLLATAFAVVVAAAGWRAVLAVIWIVAVTIRALLPR